MAQTLTTVVGQLFDSLEGITPFVLPELPIVSMGISFCGIYFSWLWGLLSAVDTATDRRHHTGYSPQASVAWAVAISWFCPGSGQIYANDRRFGFILFGAYLLGFLLIVPVYKQLFLSLSDLAKSGQLSANNPMAVIGIVHELIVRVDYSFGKVFQESIKYFAVAGTMADLKAGSPESRHEMVKSIIGVTARHCLDSVGYVRARDNCCRAATGSAGDFLQAISAVSF